MRNSILITQFSTRIVVRPARVAVAHATIADNKGALWGELQSKTAKGSREET